MRKSASETDQLPLSHGKCRAALADVCFDAFRQDSSNETEAHFAQRGFDARAADIFIAQPDVRSPACR